MLGGSSYIALFPVVGLQHQCLYSCVLSGLSHCYPVPHRALRKGTKSSPKPSREEAADAATLLQLTQSTLEQLQSEVWCS